jgi:Ice-binding-like
MLAAGCLAALALPVSGAIGAQPPVGLGTADSFAVLGGSTVTNTGPTVINGDLGLAPGSAVPGFPPGLVNGTIHVADAVAVQAKTDLVTAYNDAAGRLPALAIPADLGGLTLTGGVYKSSSSLGLTGALTLDAQGNPNTVFVFQAGSTLTTASASRVNLINGAQACNVYWQVGSSATLGTTSNFSGVILAMQSISMNNGVVVLGRAFARNGAVTMINDNISAARCTTPTGGTGPGGTGPGGTGPGGTAPGAPDTSNGSALFTTTPRSVARSIAQFGTGRCVSRTFQTFVRGIAIKRVVFSLDGRFLTTRNKAPFGALISAGDGVHMIRARVTFSDTTPPATLKMEFRSCAEVQQVAPSRPARGTSGFTG